MKYLAISIIVLTLIHCDSLQISPDTSNLLSTMTIKSGQSFGMCIGPCYQEMTIEGSKITFIVKSRDFKGPNVTNSETTYYDNLTSAEETKLASLVKANIASIKNSEETIGCPDCADGGAEWITIIENSITTNVKFEYGHFPDKFKDLSEFLSNKRTELASKFVKTE